MNVGSNIKLIRTQKKLTQKKLAEEAGITHNYLSMIENNAKVPSLNLIQKLAKILETPLAILFSELEISLDSRILTD